MARTRKKILLFLLCLLALYFVWLSFQFINFKVPKGPKEPSPSSEIKGAYHIHSTFSDGKKSVEKIAKAAARSSLDFCILTDHGNPNYESMDSQGWKEGVLVLAGSELSVNRGHLVALDFNDPPENFSQNAELAAYRINQLNGFSIIAHPYSKTHWTWGIYAGYSGIEIINADSMVKRNYLSLLAYLPALLVEPELPLLKMMSYPEKNLRKWDSLNREFSVYAYYSTDAHMFYKSLFSLLRIHIPLKEKLSADFEKAKKQIFLALRNGRFYNSIDAAAPGDGFRFWGEAGKERIYMGESHLFNESISLFIKTPDSRDCRTVLIRNGNPVLTESENLVFYNPHEPGVYRAEVYLKGKTPLNKNCPWILSNPIFLREKEHEKNQ